MSFRRFHVYSTNQINWALSLKTLAFLLQIPSPLFIRCTSLDSVSQISIKNPIKNPLSLCFGFFNLSTSLFEAKQHLEARRCSTKMPLGDRAGDKSESRYCGVETEFDDDVPQLLLSNLSSAGFDFVVAPLVCILPFCSHFISIFTAGNDILTISSGEMTFDDCCFFFCVCEYAHFSLRCQEKRYLSVCLQANGDRLLNFHFVVVLHFFFCYYGG